MRTKRVSFNTTEELHARCKGILPYRGEFTAFFNRCMEALAATQVSDDVLLQVEKLMAVAKKDVEDG